METMKLQKKAAVSTMLDPKIVVPAIWSSFAKLDPRLMIKSPVMFVVEIVAALTTVIFVRDLVTGGASLGFTFQIILWLCSPCCSPISPKPSPRAAARHRPNH
jgi:K+-transporting ATPase ATPase B chain